MSNSVFNVENLLQSTQEQAFDTEYAVVPEFSYNALVDGVKVRAAKDSTILDVTWSIDGDQATSTGETLSMVTGMPKNKVRQTLFLDITEDGRLDAQKGRNVELGRLRSALGQNQPGKVWGINMLKGGIARVQVTHRSYSDGSGKIAAEIRSVAAIA